MRYDTTVGSDLIVEAPHRLMMTTDPWIEDVGFDACDAPPEATEGGPDLLAKQMAKSMLGKLFADSVMAQP